MNNVQIDDKGVMNLFNSLDEVSSKRILLEALKKAGKELQEETKSNLKARLGNKATSPNRWNGKTLESGIRLKADKDYTEVAVNIMGDFRLKFFEKGTKDRFTKKGFYRGKMGENKEGASNYRNFFKDARNRDLSGTITHSINQSLKRISK